MPRLTIYLLFIIAVTIAIDPALAGNKFTTIGGGVSGSSHEKFQVLKSISAIFGGFLILLGVLSFITRGRFEGLVGMVTGRAFEAVTVVPVVLIILGSIMTLPYFF